VSTSFEPLCPDVALSKSEIIEDLACCVAEALRTSDCDFGDTGAWRGYAARVRVELKLIDIDESRIEKTVQIGDLTEPTINALIEVNGENPEGVRGRIAAPVPNLELGAPRPKRRWYAPRQVQRKVV
jgi:hypothetical protein